MTVPFFTSSTVDYEQSMLELAMIVCLPVLSHAAGLQLYGEYCSNQET